MNFKQLNELSRGIEEDKSPLDPKIQIFHNAWLQQPFTTQFLEFLQQEENKYTRAVVNMAASGGDYNQICRTAARAQTLKAILNYGRGTTSND
jgi:hypothetical protein